MTTIATLIATDLYSQHYGVNYQLQVATTKISPRLIVSNAVLVAIKDGSINRLYSDYVGSFQRLENAYSTRYSAKKRDVQERHVRAVEEYKKDLPIVIKLIPKKLCI